MERHRVLVVGGTGRTGAHLVRRLKEDDTLDVRVLARTPSKVTAIFGHGHGLNVVQGDMSSIDSWASTLDEIDIIVTMVSCGVRTDLLVLLGLRPEPSNLPYAIDFGAMAQLADAAKQRGVQRFVAVTSASTGTPWSMAGIFLNVVCCMSIKWKFFGEQAIRKSGLDYVIIRPFGLSDSQHEVDAGLGIEYSQGRTEGTRRRVPRDDVAKLCHEALRAPAKNVTFECWKTAEHRNALPWAKLIMEPPNSVHDVNHDVAVATAVTGVIGSLCGLTAGGAYTARRLLRFLRR